MVSLTDPWQGNWLVPAIQVGKPEWIKKVEGQLNPSAQDRRKQLKVRVHKEDKPADCVDCIPSTTNPKSQIQKGEKCFEQEGEDGKGTIPGWKLHERHFDPNKHRVVPD